MPRHEHSARAQQQTSGKMPRRKAAILEVYKHRTGLSDRDVLNTLISQGRLPGHSDINSVRPRITELIKSGLLKEVGTTKDTMSGMTVRTCGLSERLF